MLAGALRSTDAGASWSSLAIRRGLSNSAQIAPASDTTAVLVPGDQSELLRTTDGGATFTTAYPARSGFWGFVGFTDRETGTGLRILPDKARPSVGLPPHVLVRSGDGGSTWTDLPIG
jgi:hypothetical protein